MFNYKTVEEKAMEWGISPRHVQHLCQEGKIAGAVKRAGSWFIAEDAPNPVKSTKAASKPYEFVGTKKKIFDNSIKLFEQKGYENVSIKDIATTAGIRQSAVYNHFKSKQEILDTIYDYFRYYYTSNRPTTDDVDYLLETGSLLELILKGFIFDFEGGVLGQMAGITKIIIQKATTDESAAAILRDLMIEEGIRFVEDSLNRAVKIKRIAPFDTHVIALIINCTRLYNLICWLTNPPYDTYMKMQKDELSIYKTLLTLMTDLNPPADQ
jgi:AcrR family transcriptional regulator